MKKLIPIKHKKTIWWYNYSKNGDTTVHFPKIILLLILDKPAYSQFHNSLTNVRCAISISWKRNADLVVICFLYGCLVSMRQVARSKNRFILRGTYEVCHACKFGSIKGPFFGSYPKFAFIFIKHLWERSKCKILLFLTKHFHSLTFGSAETRLWK